MTLLYIPQLCFMNKVKSFLISASKDFLAHSASKDFLAHKQFTNLSENTPKFIFKMPESPFATVLC